MKERFRRWAFGQDKPDPDRPYRMDLTLSEALMIVNERENQTPFAFYVGIGIAIGAVVLIIGSALAGRYLFGDLGVYTFGGGTLFVLAYFFRRAMIRQRRQREEGLEFYRKGDETITRAFFQTPMPECPTHKSNTWVTTWTNNQGDYVYHCNLCGWEAPAEPKEIIRPLGQREEFPKADAWGMEGKPK